MPHDADHSANLDLATNTNPYSYCNTVTLDTSVLIADPDAILAFPDTDVVLPFVVVEELDQHKIRQDSVGQAAREVLRHLEELRVSAGGSLNQPVAIANGATLRISSETKIAALEQIGLDTHTPDNRILGCALAYAERSRTTVVTQDTALRLKAGQLGLAAQLYLPSKTLTQERNRKGWQKQQVSQQLIDTLHTQNTAPIETLHPIDLSTAQQLGINEYLQGVCGSASVLARNVGDTLEKVDTHTTAWGLQPRSTEQRLALDLLLNPEIPIVALSGQAGTGKTILALAAALEQTFEPNSKHHHYARVMIVRPVVSVGRAELGFLPGTVNDKMGPWMQAIVDAMVALGTDVSHQQAALTLAGWEQDDQLRMESVTYLRGRSLQATYVLIDEAQNLDALTLKTVLTRIGQGSKAVLVGDTSQIDSPWLSDTNNALEAAKASFANHPMFGYLHLERGERSAVADLAAQAL